MQVYVVARTIHNQTGLCPILVSETELIPEELQTGRNSMWGPYTIQTPSSNRMVWVRMFEKIPNIAMNTIDYIGGEKPEPVEGMKIMGPFLLFTQPS